MNCFTSQWYLAKYDNKLLYDILVKTTVRTMGYKMVAYRLVCRSEARPGPSRSASSAGGPVTGLAGGAGSCTPPGAAVRSTCPA